MKIALVSTAQALTPPAGYGSEARTHDLHLALTEQGHDVVVFAPKGSWGGASLIEIPGPITDGSMDRVRAAEAVPYYQHKETLLSCNVVHDLSLSARTHELLWSCGWAKSLVTLNGISYLTPSVPAARRNIVVVSECAKKYGLEGRSAWEGTPYRYDPGGQGQLERPPEVVRYGCDTAFYRRSSEPVEGKTVLYVGRPHISKGVGIILTLARYRKDLTFLLAWRADLYDHKVYERLYLKEIDQHKLENVRFVELPAGGSHHRFKRDLMARSSVLFHPAVYVDACPSTVIEAQSCGTPVVAFKRGGVPELVTQDTGVLVPYFNWWEDERGVIEDFGKAIDKALELDRVKVRAYAAADLSSKRMAADYVRLYERVVKGDSW